MMHWGHWLFCTGDGDTAKKLLTEASATQVKVKPVHGQAAEIMDLLAEVYMQEENWAAARPFLDQALKVWEQLHEEDTLSSSHTLILLGEYYQANGDKNNAQACYERALIPLERSAVSTHLDFERVQRNLADVV